ncbi:MAG: TonB family protein, partial [Acidobacteria bacterium]|nr:TonB family protein [Acidobacteriota bacterium]
SEPVAQTAAATSAPARSVTPPAEPGPVSATDPSTIPGDSLPQVEIAPAISPEDVDLEVSRRLEAERERLERLRQQQLAREKQSSPPAAREPEPARTTTQAPAATPSTQTTSPEPLAAEPAPAQTATGEPPPAEPPPAAPSFAAGDLVPQGTPGLVEPVLISLRKTNYPSMARARKVQGIVVVRALVTETGSVAQIEILRSPSPDFGIANAARDAVGGAKFRPATFEGKPVRAWKTLTVPFTL